MCIFFISAASRPVDDTQPSSCSVDPTPLASCSVDFTPLEETLKLSTNRKGCRLNATEKTYFH